MNKLFFSLISILISTTASFAQNEKIIGSLRLDGSFVISIDTQELQEIFQITLRNNNLRCTLAQFKIKKDTVENSATNEEYYFLIGKTATGDIKIAVDLTLNSDNIFVARLAPDFSFGSSCTCSGSCTSGCDPKHRMDNDGLVVWKCSNCTQSNKTCNKSVTAN